MPLGLRVPSLKTVVLDLKNNKSFDKRPSAKHNNAASDRINKTKIRMIPYTYIQKRKVVHLKKNFNSKKKTWKFIKISLSLVQTSSPLSPSDFVPVNKFLFNIKNKDIDLSSYHLQTNIQLP
jgi:hypothetical protein